MGDRRDVGAYFLNGYAVIYISSGVVFIDFLLVGDILRLIAFEE